MEPQELIGISSNIERQTDSDKSKSILANPKAKTDQAQTYTYNILYCTNDCTIQRPLTKWPKTINMLFRHPT